MTTANNSARRTQNPADLVKQLDAATTAGDLPAAYRVLASLRRKHELAHEVMLLAGYWVSASPKNATFWQDAQRQVAQAANERRRGRVQAA